MTFIRDTQAEDIVWWEWGIRFGGLGVGHEAFAEIASSKAVNQESYDLMKKYIPKTVAVFEEIYEKLEKGEIKHNDR